MFLLSIVVPVSLLVTLRLTGVIPEPPETITIEAISWNMNRPKDLTAFTNLKVINLFGNENISADLSVSIDTYFENSPAFDYNDVFWLIINATAKVNNGFIYSMVVKFSQVDTNAILIMDETPVFISLRNLSIQSIRATATYKHEAGFTTVSFDQSKDCSLQILVHWIFFDKENGAKHPITATLELTYFNGTIYQRIAIPVSLEVMP